MSPPAATNSLTEEIDGKRLFNAKSTIRFRLIFVSGSRALTVRPGAACPSQKTPYRNPPRLVLPKTKQLNAGHAPLLGDRLSPCVRCSEWDRREPSRGQLWERLL